MIKVNNLILPLLVSILLSTVGTLKIGQKINSFVSVALTPITAPTAIAKSALNENLSFITDLPRIHQENLKLKEQNSALLNENQNLKDAITDQKTVQEASGFTSTTPIRIVSLGKTISATTSFDMSQLKPGQPVVSGAILLGFVSKVASPIIHITPLDSDDLTKISIKTGSGQSGVYFFESRLPQIADLPSENPIILNDSVLTTPTENIPPNLIIGRITKVLSTPQEPLQKAEIKLESRFSSKATNLVIITKP